MLLFKSMGKGVWWHPMKLLSHEKEQGRNWSGGETVFGNGCQHIYCQSIVITPNICRPCPSLGICIYMYYSTYIFIICIFSIYWYWYRDIVGVICYLLLPKQQQQPQPQQQQQPTPGECCAPIALGQPECGWTLLVEIIFHHSCVDQHGTVQSQSFTFPSAKCAKCWGFTGFFTV